MKLFIMSLSLTLAISVFAFAKNSPEQTQDLVKTLIENSSAITVIDKDLNTKEKNLSELLSQALSASLYSDAKNQIVVSMESSCKASTPDGVVGVSIMDCTLMINDADYKKLKDGLKGPSTESSMIFTFKTTRPVVPHPETKILGNVVSVQRAG